MPRGNPKNFNPVRSNDEATKRGKNGGIKSGEVRRKKRAEKDYLKMMLDLQISEDKIKEKLSGMGIAEEYFNNEMLLTYKLFKLAFDGDLNAIKYIDERTGNNPQTNIKQEELNLRKREFELKEKLTEKNNPDKSEQMNNSYTFIPSHSIGKSYVDIYRDILNRKHRFYNFKGGRGSLKSSFCSLVLVDEIMRNKHFCAIALRQVKDTLKDSVYAQIVWAIEELELSHLFECTTNPMRIRKIDTGQIIYFRGADNPVKIKSIKPPNGMYIGVIWFEEKDQFDGSEAIRNIQQSVMRGGDDVIVLSSYNTPVSQQHFLNKSELIPDDKAIIHHSYYYDSPKEWLGQPFFDEAEFLKQTNEKAYRHEYLGEVTGTGGNVFENVTERVITDEEIKNFDRVLNGVDWGFYPDCWAFVRAYYHAGSLTLYIFDEAIAYKTGNRGTAEIIKNKGVPATETIIADSAEPKSIKDYQDYDLPHTRGAEKPAGSVEYSMKWLASLNSIVIDKNRTPNAYKEFISYEYERNKNGEYVSAYPDKNNHFIDAIRYATNVIWKNREGNLLYKL